MFIKSLQERKKQCRKSFKREGGENDIIKSKQCILILQQIRLPKKKRSIKRTEVDIGCEKKIHPLSEDIILNLPASWTQHIWEKDENVVKGNRNELPEQAT